MEPFLSFPEVTRSFFAGESQQSAPPRACARKRTDREHSLDEVADVAEDDAEALHVVCVARLGVHGLDLDALQDGMLDEAAIFVEYAADGALGDDLGGLHVVGCSREDWHEMWL